MRARLGLAKLILRPLSHHFAAKLDERLEHLFEIQDARLAVDDRQVDDPERRLHRRQLVQLVQYDLRNGVALELNHDSHSGAIRFVAQVGNALDLLLVDQLGNALDQTGFVDLEGDFRDNDRVALLGAAADSIDSGACAQLQNSATLNIRLSDLLATVNKSTRGKVWASHYFREIMDRSFRLLQQRESR